MTATVTSAGNPITSGLAAPIACGCCMLAGAAYVAADNPSDGGIFLPCPFRTLTGWWCPGCGLTRATHHLFRGDLAQAVRYNAFVVVILGALVATWMVWMLQRVDRTPRWVRSIPVAAQVGAVALLVAFAVVRNLPGFEALRG